MDSTNDLSFRFLALPQELRDYIYRDVLTTTYLVELHLSAVYFSARPSRQISPSLNPTVTRLAILQVSKSIHHEAKQILYGLSTFRFNFLSTDLA